MPNTEVDEETAVELTFDINEDGSIPGGTTPDQNGSNSGNGGNNGNPGNSAESGNGGDGNGDTNGTPSGNETRTKLININLDPNRTYGDEVMVYVEYTHSDTNKTYIKLNQPVPIDNFPFSVSIELAASGKTHVIVKLDGILVQETDI